MSSTSFTIAEIARRAGVGTATVDRVLNQRLGVHAATCERVRRVVSEGALRLAFVLPDGDAAFFGHVERQIALCAGVLRHQRITTVVHRFSWDDPAQYAADLAQLRDCDGVALLALDVPAVKRAIGELVRGGVHVVTLFSDVAGSARQLFVGADNRAAGRTAGLLLGHAAVASERSQLLLLAQATRLSCEIERHIGCVQVLEERFPQLQLLRITDFPTQAAAQQEVLLHQLAATGLPQDLAGIYLVGGDAAAVVGVLAQRQLRRTVALVAHDSSESHVQLLGQGALSYLLDQDAHYGVLTAVQALRNLSEQARGALHVVQPRIEILTSENLH